MTPDLARIAHHEAGHVVAALVFKRRFLYTTLREDADSIAHTRFTEPSQHLITGTYNQRRNAIEKEIMVTLAGMAVEQLMYLNSPSFLGFQDEIVVSQLALELTESGAECDAYQRWLLERTKNALSAPQAWKAIAVVAQALLEKTELTAAEVSELTTDLLAE